MNGGDNIGTYVPLLSQAKGAEIAVYVVVYYILLGMWCFAAWLLMGQKHVLRLVEKYMNWVIPFLYMGLGIYITVKSDCYPWSIEHIDNQFLLLGSVKAQNRKIDALARMVLDAISRDNTLEKGL